MKEVLLSVIVPVYNVDKYLETCLDSVVCAENDSVEIIIVNDGSTDNSLMICKDYESRYDKVILIDQENQGLSGARNSGILNASGEYLLFLDSDDFLKEGALHAIISDILKDKKDFYLGRAYRYNTKDNTYELCQTDYSRIPYRTPCRFFFDLHKNAQFWFAAWLIIVNRRFLLDNGLLFKTGIYHEDELWVPTVFSKACNMGFINYGFYCYRVAREGSIVASPKIKREFDKLIVINDLHNLSNGELDAKEMIRDRQASLVAGIVLSLWKFVDNSDYPRLETELKDSLHYLNYGKYKLLYVLCNLLSPKAVSKVIKANI